MTFKIIEILKLIRGKSLHIFLCLVLIFAFCFKDSVPSAEAVNSEDYLQTEAYGSSDGFYGIEIEQTEEITVFAEAVPILLYISELPSYSEAVAETSETTEEQTESEATAEIETAAEDTVTEEETAADEITVEETTVEETTEEEITEAEETAPEAIVEETEAVTEAAITEASNEHSFSLNSSYGQRYQEQWEIDYADQLFDLVNAEREKYGIAPLKKLDALTAAATERAWEVTRYNSHTRPDGTSCFTVLPQYGLSLSRRAENVAYYSKTPQAALNSLMSNYSHREPILNSKFEYMGVGFYCVYDDASGYHYYWTQIFYTP